MIKFIKIYYIITLSDADSVEAGSDINNTNNNDVKKNPAKYIQFKNSGRLRKDRIMKADKLSS